MKKNIKQRIRNLIPNRVKQFVAYSDEVEYGVISFSQFGEDMILKNLFPGKLNCFYVDIGAHHPVKYSNTYYFYKLGWSGIVIDPLPKSESKFREKRPRDIFLEMGVSDEPGDIQYYQFKQSLYNTFSSERAKEIGDKISPLLTVTNVSVKRLDEILINHLPASRKIDLLSIDAEGFDLRILKSNDWSKYRPTVIVVENLAFQHTDFVNDEISKFLHKQGYSLVAFTQISLFFKLMD